MIRICSRCSKVIGTDDAYYSINKAVRGAKIYYFHGDESHCHSYTQPASEPATDENPGPYYTATVADGNGWPVFVAEDMQPDIRSECPDAAKPLKALRQAPVLGKYAQLTTPEGVEPVSFWGRGG